MRPDDDEKIYGNPNTQRRAILRGALVSGCAISFPLLWGCKQKEPPPSASAPDAVPPVSDIPPASSGAQQPADSSASNAKMSKAQAQYQTQPKGEQQCSNCMHFLADTSTCKLVEGQIDPQAWCILWAKQPG